MTYFVHAIFPKRLQGSNTDSELLYVEPGDTVINEAYVESVVVTDKTGQYAGVEAGPWVRLSINNRVVLDVPSDPAELHLVAGEGDKRTAMRLPDTWVAPNRPPVN